MQPRYFIGITLPADFSTKIEKIQHSILSDHMVMEPLVPHITLLHPNVLMTISPIYLIPKIKAIASGLMPLNIELTKTGMFDKRVLHIKVKSAELSQLQSSLVELLPDDIRARYQIGREFTPHVTLAQAKPLGQLPDELIDQVSHEVEPLLPFTFRAANVSQFTWKKPREYKVEIV